MIPADKLELAQRIVYEALTGKCWHTPKHKVYDNGTEDAMVTIKCDKCDMELSFVTSNPDLVNSLDAWRPLWEGMDAIQRANHSIRLAKLETGSLYMWDFKAIHHLEVALRSIKVECDKCEGTGRIPTLNVKNDVTIGNMRIKSKGYIDCTCTNGEITLWDKMEVEG